MKKGMSASGARGRITYLALVAIVAAAYYGAAKLGLSLAFMTSNVTAIWPPTGIALAALLLGGYRFWPAVALGAFTANAWTEVPLYTTLGITTGNTLEALTGAFLLNHFAGFQPTLLRMRDVATLAFFGGIVSTMVSATIGVGSLLAGDVIEAGDFDSVWRTWWLGDMGGNLVIAPAILVFATHFPFREVPGRPIEAIGLGIVVAAVGTLIFTNETSLTFLAFPAVVAVVIRFWQVGAVGGALILAAIAIPLTDSNQGVFAGASPDDRLLLAQAFIGVVATTQLMLAAILTERRQIEQTLEQIAGTLQESLAPPALLPEIPGVELAIEYRPAGERQIVGGDYYDVFATEDGSWAIVVGDVLGKGPTAAATTALARYTIRATAIHETRPSAILSTLNDAILKQMPGQSCTAALARLRLEGGEARIAFSSGGHPPPLLLRAGGEIAVIESDESRVLGVTPDPPLADRPLMLRAGDALLLYTDGLTDAYAPHRILAPEDLATPLREASGLGAQEIADRVTAHALSAGKGKPRDDVIVLVLKLAG